jgi:hypothetical protein
MPVAADRIVARFTNGSATSDPHIVVPNLVR